MGARTYSNLKSRSTSVIYYDSKMISANRTDQPFGVSNKKRLKNDRKRIIIGLLAMSLDNYQLQNHLIFIFSFNNNPHQAWLNGRPHRFPPHLDEPSRRPKELHDYTLITSFKRLQ
jgi:hypothetical protein